MLIGVADREFVEVTLHCRSHPQATDFWDGNWLTATVRAAGHGLLGDVGAQLRVDELASLATQLSELHRTLAGRIEFWPMEPNLKLTFEMAKTGKLTVFVEIQPDLADPARMAFELRLDQTFIPGIVAQLRADLEPFPQLGQP